MFPRGVSLVFSVTVALGKIVVVVSSYIKGSIYPRLFETRGIQTHGVKLATPVHNQGLFTICCQYFGFVTLFLPSGSVLPKQIQNLYFLLLSGA